MRTLLVAVLALLTGAAISWGVVKAPSAQLDRPAAAVASRTDAAAASTTAASTAPATADAPQLQSDWPADAPSPEQVMYAQPRMVERSLAAMTPRVAGAPNLYLLAFAGDGAEDVFRNEAEYAARVFTTRYGPRAHALVLENNPATLATQPLASWSNLQLALAGLAKRMDLNQDILVLYLTSHGSEDHYLLVDMDPLPLDQLGAQDLAGILAEHPFKWKVVIVNACYSGGFIPPLKGAGTMIITAARADRSSFGCGSDSDITYFGRAFLVNGLNHSNSFVDVFKRARGEVSRWEARDEFKPSEPQIDVGRAIEQQLAQWRQGITPGPALPFKPAAPARAGSTSTP